MEIKAGPNGHIIDGGDYSSIMAAKFVEDGNMTHGPQVGDPVTYIRDHWMGGIKKDIQRIPAYVSGVRSGISGGLDGRAVYNLDREGGTPLEYNVSERRFKKIPEGWEVE